ncbi:MAG: signal peptidase I [Candidatus Komeilibacteria bacterium]|nr:signal peptidase I [Candidatus Komeilibacteria bacterium]
MNIIDLRGETDDQQTTLGQEPNLEPSSSGHGFKEYFFEIVKIIVFSLAIIIPVRMFVVQPFIVEGDSMVPNFHDGEYLIVDEISYRFKTPQRGDVVIFHPPLSPNVYYIKRIIGLPAETVELKDGKIFIYNNEFPQGQVIDESGYLTQNQVNEESRVLLTDEQYYVVGDNRANSLDSRRIGPITTANIKGKALLRAFPFNKFTLFKTPINILP